MSTKNCGSIEELEARAGVERSEPGGRAELNAGGAPADGSPPLPGLPGGGLAERPELPDELIDELLAGAQTAEEIAGPDGLLGQLTRRLLERALAAELTEHVGYRPGQAPPGGAGNATASRPRRSSPIRARSGSVRRAIAGARSSRRSSASARRAGSGSTSR